MSVVELTREEIECVAGGYPVCTVPGSGSFTLANGGTLNYTSQTIHSNSSTTFSLTDGTQYTTAPITDPYARAIFITSICKIQSGD